jgi:hypothetical protein
MLVKQCLSRTKRWITIHTWKKYFIEEKNMYELPVKSPRVESLYSAVASEIWMKI